MRPSTRVKEWQRLHGEARLPRPADVPLALLLVGHRVAGVAVLRHEGVEVDERPHPLGDAVSDAAASASCTWVSSVTGQTGSSAPSPASVSATPRCPALPSSATNGSYHQPPWQEPAINTNVVIARGSVMASDVRSGLIGARAPGASRDPDRVPGVDRGDQRDERRDLVL